MFLSRSRQLKLAALGIIVVGAIATLFILPARPASAEVDDAIEQIASYRSWKRVTKEPISVSFKDPLKIPPSEALPALPTSGFSIDPSDGGGWTFLAFELTGPASPYKDVYSILKRAGKHVAKAFHREPRTARVIAAAPTDDPAPAVVTPVDHKHTFGVIYANHLAAPEMSKIVSTFPVGSIIVREKNAELSSLVPTTVIAMVKRQPGFSTETGDWEFMMFEGASLALMSRQTTGSCSTCHARAKNSDWVFREF